MSYRQELPQLDGDLFLTDGGIETTLIFHKGLDLPLFAAFDLLKKAEGSQRFVSTTPPTSLSLASVVSGLCSRAPHGEQVLAGRMNWVTPAMNSTR